MKHPDEDVRLAVRALRCGDLRAIVSQLVGDAFSVVAADDPADGSVAIDQDGHQDAVDVDVVP
jgi:hypothetical protein